MWKDIFKKDNLQTHIQTHFLVKNVDGSTNMIVEYICSFCIQTFRTRSKEDLLKHFETDLACNINCQQLCQEVTEYPDGVVPVSRNQNQINAEIIFTQVVDAESTPSEVFAEIVDNNSEIILVDNDADLKVLIIEEPVDYI